MSLISSALDTVQRLLLSYKRSAISFPRGQSPAQKRPSLNQGTGSSQVPRPRLAHKQICTRATHASQENPCLSVGVPQGWQEALVCLDAPQDLRSLTFLFRVP